MEDIFVIAALIMSIVLHEMAHGHAANWLGDPTARLQGRLSPNPLVHIDPIGSIIVPAFLFFSGAGILFGWAKPVPYNPYNLSDQKYGEAKVAAAGPAVNIAIAILFGLFIRFGDVLGLSAAFIDLSAYIVYINILLALFNMIPIPPLDGSKILAAILPFDAQMKYREFTRWVERWGLFFTFAFIFIFINLFWLPFSQLVWSVFELFTGTRGFNRLFHTVLQKTLYIVFCAGYTYGNNQSINQEATPRPSQEEQDWCFASGLQQNQECTKCLQLAV